MPPQLFRLAAKESWRVNMRRASACISRGSGAVTDRCRSLNATEVGTGPFGNIVDLYDVRCSGGTPAQSKVYMDMYFGDYIENRPVPGFTIVPQ